ncbi:MAG: 4-(cytidine 5'-diphospho)-2-C-methyl-D-erythritol kinase [Opitutaceae bacterium]
MSDPSQSIELHSPAKVNLMLSVHGPQADGFHALTSVVVALEFGDLLTTQLAKGEQDLLRCTDPAVPLGSENLVMKAAVLFREKVGGTVYFEFDLDKRIPMGAGLGGGSSNASVALRAMNTLLGEPLSISELLELAAQLGSDCPFFIEARPSIMRGRGEILEPLDADCVASLLGQKLVLFRPDFGVETAWAYGQLRANAPSSYEAEPLAESRLNTFQQTKQLADLLFNSFQPIVGRKYIALECLLEDLTTAGVPCLMSGSGSCCFALLDDSRGAATEIYEICQNAWGQQVFWVETSIC